MSAGKALASVALVAGGGWFAAGAATLWGGTLIGAATGGLVAAIKGDDVLEGAMMGGALGAGAQYISSAVGAGEAAATTGESAIGAGETAVAGTTAAPVAGAAVAPAATAAAPVAAAPAAGMLSGGEKMILASSLAPAAAGLLGPSAEETAAANAEAQGEEQAKLADQSFEHNRRKYQEGVSTTPVTFGTSLAPDTAINKTTAAPGSVTAGLLADEGIA